MHHKDARPHSRNLLQLGEQRHHGSEPRRPHREGREVQLDSGCDDVPNVGATTAMDGLAQKMPTSADIPRFDDSMVDIQERVRIMAERLSTRLWTRRLRAPALTATSAMATASERSCASCTTWPAEDC